MVTVYKLTNFASAIRFDDEDPDAPTCGFPFADGNADYARYLADVEAGATVLPSDPLTDPGPTQAEQVDQLVADGKAAIAAANLTSPESKALAQIFAGALAGLGAIYGTGQEVSP